MKNPTYDREEIDKNLALVIQCSKQCLSSLAGVDDNKRRVLENRLKLTFLIADYVLTNIGGLPIDEYLSKARLAIQSCREKWQDYLLRKQFAT